MKSCNAVFRAIPGLKKSALVMASISPFPDLNGVRIGARMVLDQLLIEPDASVSFGTLSA
jgi:hypothetical protein